MPAQAFQLLLIGAELLNGRRSDKHLAHVIDTLQPLGHRVAFVQMVDDSEAAIVEALKHSQKIDLPCLCFGGIGATPDDRTRQAAALAFKQPLSRHAAAVACIEAQFGSAAYPNRVLMADLPEACALIPNPYNQIPGFHCQQHFFFPGFPAMAWPMLDGVLQDHFQAAAPRYSQSYWLYGVGESQIVQLLQQEQNKHVELDQHCLPGYPPASRIELGYSGADKAQVQEAMNSLKAGLQALEMEVFEAPQNAPVSD